MTKLLENIEDHISEAVAYYWCTRNAQKEKQEKRGVSDANYR
jgi:hypothetical protein